MPNAKFSEPANILCVGNGWLLSKPGGLERYVYELTHHLIPGGVDTTYFRPNLSRQEARVQLNWPSDRPILFTPRRLVHLMGLDKLLTALIKVKAQVPDVWLAIAGKGPLRNDKVSPQNPEQPESNNQVVSG
jgi:glycosyltransferase involved in cell wall biosynthesis